MTGIRKRFGAVVANEDVSLRISRGTVHGIVGENGAGKSTLMSILCGRYGADSGQIAVDGRPVRIRHARDAMALGIGMVPQHFAQVERFDAVDNVMLGAEPAWRLGPARRRVRHALDVLMRASGLPVRLDVAVEDMPLGERQRLEVLRALHRGARILVLDEPTAVLTPAEAESLFATLRQLRERGTTVVLVTHKLKEVAALCDRVTVMRGGRVVLDAAMRDTSADALAEAMVGRHVQLGRDGHLPNMPGEEDAPLLSAQGLGWVDRQGARRLDDVSLDLHPGEIVGVAGVSGNGQSELLDVLAGLAVPTEGRLDLNGERFGPARWLTPRTARRLGLAHVPEDRQRRGLVMDFSVWESALLGYHQLRRYACGGFIRRRTALADAGRMMAEHDIRPLLPVLASSALSGGNQQKLVLARELFQRPTVLLAGQPTRGVDVGAIEFIRARLRALRDAGGAVLLVSSDLDEILALSDRVLVMAGGRIAGEWPIAACDEATLGRAMAGLR